MNPIPILLAALVESYKTTPPSGLPEGFGFFPEISDIRRERPCAVFEIPDEVWKHPEVVDFRLAISILHRADAPNADAVAGGAAADAVATVFEARLNDALPAIHESGWSFRTGYTDADEDGPDGDGWTFKRQWRITLIHH